MAAYADSGSGLVGSVDSDDIEAVSASVFRCVAAKDAADRACGSTALADQLAYIVGGQADLEGHPFAA